MDIDQLSTELLWRLDRYTRGIAQKVRKKSSSKPLDPQGGKPAATPDFTAEAVQPFNGKRDKSGDGDSSSSSSGSESSQNPPHPFPAPSLPAWILAQRACNLDAMKAEMPTFHFWEADAR